jgi:hypothetical protein
MSEEYPISYAEIGRKINKLRNGGNMEDDTSFLTWAISIFKCLIGLANLIVFIFLVTWVAEIHNIAKKVEVLEVESVNREAQILCTLRDSAAHPSLMGNKVKPEGYTATAGDFNVG